MTLGIKNSSTESGKPKLTLNAAFCNEEVQGAVQKPDT